MRDDAHRKPKACEARIKNAFTPDNFQGCGSFYIEE